MLMLEFRGKENEVKSQADKRSRLTWASFVPVSSHNAPLESL